MKGFFYKFKGLGFILWQGRHMFYHVLLGLVWAWFLRELWGKLNPRWVLFSVSGSLLPDIEHLIYFFGYGKKESYTRHLINLARNRSWRMLFASIATGHKYNTNLSYHNYYSIIIFMGIVGLSYIYEWQLGVILFGAIVIHYLYDIVDDLLVLGYINDNWKRWGRGK